MESNQDKFSQTFSASSRVVWNELAGEAVLLDLDRGIYYGLDEVGAVVWRMIQQPCALDHVRDVILDEFEVSREECERDLLALVNRLTQAGLVAVKHAGN